MWKLLAGPGLRQGYFYPNKNPQESQLPKVHFYRAWIVLLWKAIHLSWFCFVCLVVWRLWIYIYVYIYIPWKDLKKTWLCYLNLGPCTKPHFGSCTIYFQPPFTTEILHHSSTSVALLTDHWYWITFGNRPVTKKSVTQWQWLIAVTATGMVRRLYGVLQPASQVDLGSFDPEVTTDNNAIYHHS